MFLVAMISCFWMGGIDKTHLLFTFRTMIFARNSADFYYNGPLWFIPTLFLIELIYFFLNKINNKDVFNLTTISMFFIGWFFCLLSQKVNVFIWNIPVCFFSLGFYALGHKVLRPIWFAKTIENYSKKRFVAIFLVSLTLIIPVALTNGKISLGQDVVNNGIFLYITGVFGSVSILSLSRVFQSNFIVFIGRNSFLFLGIHGLVRFVYIQILSVLFSIDFWAVCDKYFYSIPALLFVFFVTCSIVQIKVIVSKRVLKRSR